MTDWPCTMGMACVGFEARPLSDVMPSLAKPLRSPTCTLMSHYAAGRVMGDHADGASKISVVLAGHVREAVGRQEETATQGSVAIKPGDVVHRNQFGPAGATMISLDLPPDLLALSEHGSLARWRWCHGGPLTAMAIRLWLASRSNAQTCLAESDAGIEFVAQLDALGQGPEPTHRPAWLRRVHERLQDAPFDAARLSLLAREVGVHPVYLARTFRRHHRCSVRDYVHALRHTRAVQRMATSSQSLAEVALACGYADQSHMSRDCRRHLGLSPRQCRSWLRMAPR